MTISIDPALVARLSGEFDSLAGEFTALGGQMNTLGRDLASLHRQVLSAARTESPGTVPSPGVRVGGMHTPQQPGSAFPA